MSRGFNILNELFGITRLLSNQFPGGASNLCPVTAMVTGFFVVFFGRLTPTLTPYRKLPRNALNELLHAGGAFLLHFVGDMPVNVQRECRCGVAEIVLDRFDIVPGMNCGHGIRMPQVVKARVRPPDGRSHFF